MTNSIFCPRTWTNTTHHSGGCNTFSSLSSSGVLSHSAYLIWNFSYTSIAVTQLLYQFSRTARTKYHTLNGLKNRHLLSHSLEAYSPRLRCLQGHAPLEGTREGSLPGLSPSFWQFFGPQQLSSSVHMAFSLYTCLCSDFPLYIRTPLILEQRPTLLNRTSS